MFTMFDETDIDKIAEKQSYKKIRVGNRDKDKMTSYVGNDYRINVFLTTGTVALCKDKPKADDPTIVFRRNMKTDDIVKMFEEPNKPVRKCFHRMSNGEKEERLYDVSTCKFRFRYERMESAFIDDLDSIYEDANSISLGYDSYFILNHDGSYKYHNIPSRLKDKLKDRPDSIPEIVQLGSYHSDTYFIQFADGKKSWRKIPEELEDILDDTDKYVDVIAMGEEDDYYVKLSNGREYWSIPNRLAERLRGKHSERTISGVSLGYDDEYSVRFSDCSMTSNMKSKTFWREYDDINDSTGVKQVIVGAKGDYIILG